MNRGDANSGVAGGREAAGFADEFEAWAVGALERGRAAWPGLTIDRDELARAVGARLADLRDGRRVEFLDALDAAELTLAIACARGDTLALRLFRRCYFEPVVARLRQMGLGDPEHDDVGRC